ncbi:hypothetical protein PAEPH01_1795 [Pancytospora epiphaga]|nr:hypothetical protein PAEPH01_1795 [Pancytospora epiphaga]
MNERIEEDRRLLRAGKKKAPQGTFSYISSLTTKKPKEKTWLRIHNLSTINILNYIDESYNLGDKYVLQRLKDLRAVLLSRVDLFDAVLLFLTNAVVRSELHYWQPGLGSSSIFSFVSELIPDFVGRYKAYYARCTIMKGAVLDCTSFIKERFKNSIDQLLVIQEDLQLFDHCITLPYWLDTQEETISEECLRLIAEPNRIDVAKDVEAFLVPELSFVECTIGNREIIVSLAQLDGLLIKNEKMREFWMAEGIIDENWCFIV